MAGNIILNIYKSTLNMIVKELKELGSRAKATTNTFWTILTFFILNNLIVIIGLSLSFQLILKITGGLEQSYNSKIYFKQLKLNKLKLHSKYNNLHILILRYLI